MVSTYVNQRLWNNGTTHYESNSSLVCSTAFSWLWIMNWTWLILVEWYYGMWIILNKFNQIMQTHDIPLPYSEKGGEMVTAKWWSFGYIRLFKRPGGFRFGTMGYPSYHPVVKVIVSIGLTCCVSHGIPRDLVEVPSFLIVRGLVQDEWVCLKIAYPYTQWLMIIIPTKWL